MCWLMCGRNAADAVAKPNVDEEAKGKKLMRGKLLKLISKTKKYLKEAEDEHKVCCKKRSVLQRKSDSGIKNAKFLKHCEKNNKDIAFKAKEVNVVKKALVSLVDELNELYDCHDHKDDIMNMEISDSDDESESNTKGGVITEADEKKKLLKQLFATKKQQKEAVSERKVCLKTWRQMKDNRLQNAKLRKDPEENKKFSTAIEKLRSAFTEEKTLKNAYARQVEQLSKLYGCQDDVQEDATIEADDTDLSEISDTESESDIHHSDSEIEGEGE